MVAALDALRELDLLRRRQERHLADVLEEELERIGRDLGLRLDLGRVRLGLLVRRDDRDLRLVERGVELVQLRGLEVELVERKRDLVGVEPPGLEPALDETLRLVRREDVLDPGRVAVVSGLPASTAPLASRRVTR